MKIFNKVSIVIVAVAFVLGLTGPIAARAALTPSLGAADTFVILTGIAGTYSNTTVTTLTGDVGYSTGPATPPTMVSGTIYGALDPTPQARIDAAAALTTLAANPCTENLGVIVNLSTVAGHTTGLYTPGVYCSTGAMSIGTAGITLSGAGTYIFRAVGELDSAAGSTVTLANGASSCDVFWTPTAATTLGANTTFKGTIIDNANAITSGANTAWIGRALTLDAGTITTDTNTITRACSIAALTAPVSGGGGPSEGTINVVKIVINDSGGTKTIADFPLFVNDTPVVSGVTNTFPTPAPAYSVTEKTASANYALAFSGDCDTSGHISLSPGDQKFCIITNNDIGAPAVVPPVPPLIDMVKTASPLSLPAGPGSVVYTYTLRNIGTVPVTNITIVGDTCSPIILASGDTNGDRKLDVNETWVHTCTQALSKTHTNTAVATGWANGISVTDIASATVVVGLPIVPPLIHVTKIPSSLTLPAGGGMITYTKKIANPGTVPLSNIRLTDDKCSPVKYISGDTNGDSKLDTNETWTYTCSTKLTQTTTNTVTASGDANGLTARDLAFAHVIVAAAAPKLPNTGIGPDEKSSTPWNIIIPTGIFVTLLFSFYLARKKLAV